MLGKPSIALTELRNDVTQKCCTHHLLIGESIQPFWLGRLLFFLEGPHVCPTTHDFHDFNDEIAASWIE